MLLDRAAGYLVPALAEPHIEHLEADEDEQRRKREHRDEEEKRLGKRHHAS
jgi:hypothetical protein